MSANHNNTFVIATGSVQYDMDEASTPIDDMITMLRRAKNMGAEYITLGSGTYRGTKFQTVYAEGDLAGHHFDIDPDLDGDDEA